MKTQTRFLLLLFLSVFTLNTMAQRGTVIVFAPKGEKFTLHFGNTLQNSEPAARVESDNPGGPSFKIRVSFPDPNLREISKLVFNKPGSTLYYKVEKNAKGVFTLESTGSEWMDNATGTPAAATTPEPEKKEAQPVQTAKDESGNSAKSAGCETPMPDPDFTAQLVDISARPFEPMQLSAAKKMAEKNCLSVSQVILVIHVFDTESSRLSFAKFAYDHAHDRENYGDVKDALHSEKSKDDLDRYVAGKVK
jgi:hypothetical protein